MIVAAQLKQADLLRLREGELVVVSRDVVTMMVPLLQGWPEV